MLFVGEYQVVFSGSGRIVIPKKIREALGDVRSFTLTKGFDQCLSGWRNKDWEKGTQELMGPSVLEMRKVEMKRHLFSGAIVLEIDDQGRVVIPKHLIKYADLQGNDVVIIGVGAFFEVWNTDKWKLYVKNNEKNISNIAAKE